MSTAIQPLFAESHLRSLWGEDYEGFCGSEDEKELVSILERWSARDRTHAKETTEQGTFVALFFKQSWGYHASGEAGGAHGSTALEQFPVPGAGARGGTGAADLALGWFGRDDVAGRPQVLCEFKDVRSGLDAPQARKDNARSPVQQCGDYLKHARQGLYGNEAIQPTWAIVTDMNEFRLYHHATMPARALRFVIAPTAGDPAPSLLGDDETSRFHRFLFARVFSREWLLSEGGPSLLARALATQLVVEQEVEREFYLVYRGYRAAVYHALVAANPEFVAQHPKSHLVRLAQRFLDRCLFLLFAEDMGPALGFPRDLLRDLVWAASNDPYYSADSRVLGERIKELFDVMNRGGSFGGQTIHKFNGGLFRRDAELDSIILPTSIFCAKGQGHPDTLPRHPDTLLYLSATYNFGVRSARGERVIDLLTLGRIFEQSITELEYLEAEADGVQSVAELTKRKRDGVYYTPEVITHYIVQETLGARLNEIKGVAGLIGVRPVTDEDAEAHRAHAADKRRTPVSHVTEYLKALSKYEAAIPRVRVVDPACGSGAFLIQAFGRLLDEYRWLAAERARIAGPGQIDIFDQDAAMKAVLRNNLYGVDLNPESVEITRLALWLRTSLPGRELSDLDHTIRCGNSLVGPDFWEKHTRDLFSEDASDRINAFDWQTAFPEVLGPDVPADERGFDCVIGNPPYVKLQHFRKIQSEVAEYLTGRHPDGRPRFESAQTGNFDLYLPFIERGISLLRPDGRMGYIAQNAWTVAQYGRALRNRLLETRRLERWLDFRGYQIFAEATTYTAIQFFRGRPMSAVQLRHAPDGELGGIDWESVADSIPYAELPRDEAWVLQPGPERRLLARLGTTCQTLGEVADGIFVGIQTSADAVYHLERVSSGRYLLRYGNLAPEEVAIEDGLMRPLVSGPEAKRYEIPHTTTYLLFPYTVREGVVRLLSIADLEAQYPLGLRYLRRFEQTLRAREGGKFDDESWHRFGRNQNIDKQELPKLGVAQTVPEMRVFFDAGGECYLNNVRVNGILPPDSEVGWYLLGVLNSPVCDFVFRRTAKVIEVGKYEANKQFIAPLPIPHATVEQRQSVAARAQRLQRQRTRLRDAGLLLNRKLAGSQTETDERPPSQLWAAIHDVAWWKAQVSPTFKGKARTAEAKAQYENLLAPHVNKLSAALRPGARLEVTDQDGALGVSIDGRQTPIRDFELPDGEREFIAAQWRHFVRKTNVTTSFDGTRLLRGLLTLRKTANAALIQAVTTLDNELRTLEEAIAREEEAMNDLLYTIYGLTPEERALVESDRVDC
jgi:hypothetical protein